MIGDCNVLVSSDDPPKVLKSSGDKVLVECEPVVCCPLAENVCVGVQVDVCKCGFSPFDDSSSLDRYLESYTSFHCQYCVYTGPPPTCGAVIDCCDAVLTRSTIYTVDEVGVCSSESTDSGWTTTGNCTNFGIYCGLGCAVVTTTATTRDTVRTQGAPPCGDCTVQGTNTTNEVIAVEYTDEMLEGKVDAKLAAQTYGTVYEDTGCVALRQLYVSMYDQTCITKSKFKHKFVFSAPLEESCTLQWLLRTVTLDGLTTLSVELQTEVVPAGATESSVHEVFPPSGDAYTLVNYPVGACCKDGACTYNIGPDCVSSGGVYQGDCSKCEPNPC